MATKRIDRNVDAETMTVIFTEVATEKVVSCALSDLSPEMVQRLALHGLNAKVGDSAASKDVDAIEAMTRVFGDLKEGNWSVRSSGGGAGRSTQLAQAVVNATGQEMEAVVAKLADMSDEDKKTLRSHPQVKAELEKIKLAAQQEKAKASAKAAKGEDTPLEF